MGITILIYLTLMLIHVKNGYMYHWTCSFQEELKL